MDSRPLIRESLQLLRFIGLHPFYNTLIYCICEKFAVIFALTTLIDNWYMTVSTYQGIDSAMEILMAIVMTQINIKMLFFIVHKVEIRLLINNIGKFWKPNLLYVEQEKENEKIFFFVRLCMRLFVVLLFLIFLVYFIKPLIFIKFSELPWISYCSRKFSFKICYIFQCLQMPIQFPMQICFELFFISLITNIVCELKLLEKHFPDLRIDPMTSGTNVDVMNKLKELIDHHNLILKCISKIKDMYSFPLLGLFMLAICSICFSIIVISSSSASNSTKLLCGMASIFYLMQMFLFCLLGSLLTDESAEITYAVYKSKWWIKKQPELRKSLVLIMRRANKSEILIAGGILQINLATFTQIIKGTFSFFTFMQTMYKDS